MDLFFWIVDLLIPVLMIVIGIVYKKHAPKKINHLHGYRTKESMKSQEAWDFAQNHFSKIWLVTGLLLGVSVVISKLLSPIAPEYLSLIHAGTGIIALIIPIPFIEAKLKKRF